MNGGERQLSPDEIKRRQTVREEKAALRAASPTGSFAAFDQKASGLDAGSTMEETLEDSDTETVEISEEESQHVSQLLDEFIAATENGADAGELFEQRRNELSADAEKVFLERLEGRGWGIDLREDPTAAPTSKSAPAEPVQAPSSVDEPYRPEVVEHFDFRAHRKEAIIKDPGLSYRRESAVAGLSEPGAGSGHFGRQDIEQVRDKIAEMPARRWVLRGKKWERVGDSEGDSRDVPGKRNFARGGKREFLEPELDRENGNGNGNGNENGSETYTNGGKEEVDRAARLRGSPTGKIFGKIPFWINPETKEADVLGPDGVVRTYGYGSIISIQDPAGPDKPRLRRYYSPEVLDFVEWDPLSREERVALQKQYTRERQDRAAGKRQGERRKESPERARKRQNEIVERFINNSDVKGMGVQDALLDAIAPGRPGDILVVLDALNKRGYKIEYNPPAKGTDIVAKRNYARQMGENFIENQKAGRNTRAAWMLATAGMDVEDLKLFQQEIRLLGVSEAILNTTIPREHVLMLTDQRGPSSAGSTAATAGPTAEPYRRPPETANVRIARKPVLMGEGAIKNVQERVLNILRRNKRSDQAAEDEGEGAEGGIGTDDAPSRRRRPRGSIDALPSPTPEPSTGEATPGTPTAADAALVGATSVEVTPAVPTLTDAQIAEIYKDAKPRGEARGDVSLKDIIARRGKPAGELEDGTPWWRNTDHTATIYTEGKEVAVGRGGRLRRIEHGKARKDWKSWWWDPNKGEFDSRGPVSGIQPPITATEVQSPKEVPTEVRANRQEERSRQREDIHRPGEESVTIDPKILDTVHQDENRGLFSTMLRREGKERLLRALEEPERVHHADALAAEKYGHKFVEMMDHANEVASQIVPKMSEAYAQESKTLADGLRAGGVEKFVEAVRNQLGTLAVTDPSHFERIHANAVKMKEYERGTYAALQKEMDAVRERYKVPKEDFQSIMKNTDRATRRYLFRQKINEASGWGRRLLNTITFSIWGRAAAARFERQIDSRDAVAEAGLKERVKSFASELGSAIGRNLSVKSAFMRWLTAK